ncbi:peptidyl-tRNA hydrolase II [Coniophora puteana RWD-64-598 SS2]|uniref:peptidyl-tRNA hydrolase n=1 Tax=Coniophora puteana (strain RWD-64-598) TaxID=741705 RepID=A0A5M3MMP4_CONPW|nr:peptidyl-tRNA hydrolase II [Coniophora puteana RWD-64-598 SS2]EIW80297.1 peptidyl-tRNA hydrolase II [Coniophora puteana RWD-64-598 SS2]
MASGPATNLVPKDNKSTGISDSESQVPRTDAPPKKESPLVMQIVVRRDLLEDSEERSKGWGVGPLMAQVAHAATAVIHETRGDPNTQAYLADLKGMHKLVHQVPNGTALVRLSEVLTTAGVLHHLWVEQPENVPTCLALAPNRRDNKIKKALKKADADKLWQG